jgi:hypothetical protein
MLRSSAAFHVSLRGQPGVTDVDRGLRVRTSKSTAGASRQIDSYLHYSVAGKVNNTVAALGALSHTVHVSRYADVPAAQAY